MMARQARLEAERDDKERVDFPAELAARALDPDVTRVIAGESKLFELRRTARGYVATDAVTAQTSCAGVYAIGEVAQRQHPCVVTALADGVVAAKAIQASIEQNGS